MHYVVRLGKEEERVCYGKGWHLGNVDILHGFGARVHPNIDQLTSKAAYL